MNNNPFNNPLVRMTREIDALKKKLAALVSNRALYMVLNENTPAQPTASVNDYAPGDFDILRMSSSAAWNITGISGGKKGRVLHILNVGAQNILLLHQSASSSAANRIISPTAATITLGTNDSAVLYYDSTDARWRFLAYSL